MSKLSEIKSRMRDLLIIGHFLPNRIPQRRNLYVMVVKNTQTRKHVKFFVAKGNEILNVTREVGIITDCRFTNDFSSLSVTDTDLIVWDLSEKVFGHSKMFDCITL